MTDTAADSIAAQSARLQSEHAECAIERLEDLARSLDQIVHEEIRAAFCEEFAMLGSAAQRAADALVGVRKTASMRLALWAIGVAAASAAIPVLVARTVLPSPRELVQLRRERAQLAASVARLERAGGKIDLRRCGAEGRLCVRVERDGPAYGAHADYLLVKDE